MKIFGFDLNNARFINANLILFFALLQKSASVLLLPLYTRYMNPEQYGILAVCITFSILSWLIPFLSLQDAVYFSTLEKKKEQSEVLGIAFAFEGLITSVGLILLGIIWSFVPNRSIFGIPWYPYLFFTLVGGPFFIFLHTCLEYLRAAERMKEYSTLNFSFFIVLTSFTIYFLIVDEMKAFSFVLANLITNILFAVISVFWLRKDITWTLKPSLLISCLKFSIPLVPHNVCFWVKSSADRIILSSFISSEVAGIYHIAVSYSQPLFLGVTSFASANNPRFFGLINEKNNEKKITDALDFSMGIFVIGALFMSFFSREALHLFTTPGFYSAEKYIPFILSGVLFFLIYSNIIQLIYHKKESHTLPLISFTAITISTLISIPLVKYFSIEGIAVSNIIANALLAFFVFNRCQKIMPLPWPIKRAVILCFFPLVPLLINSWISSMGNLGQIIIKSTCFFLMTYLLYNFHIRHTSFVSKRI
ncbi:MAG: oligosaccharide flippase family protein [Candidatus Riflebacteria bacterium]|nr:oligosaccharide flippase family protein [Candidatus Riflebacteria bacterium]